MFELLNNTSDAYADELTTITKAIADIEAEPSVPINMHREVVINAVDEQNNVLNMDIRERFQHELRFAADDIFSQPITTTITMEGFLSNVRFKEEEFIKILGDCVSKDVVVIDCNYGKYVYPGYIEPVKIKTNNRGRKKKVKESKPRKKQGTGRCFNSQVTFQIRAGYGPEPVYNEAFENDHSLPEWIVDSKTPVYKFKVFRTGKIQLPGAKPHIIDDVISKIDILISILNNKLHPREASPDLLTNVININPVMKNYKFILGAKKHDDIVDLGALKLHLLDVRGKSLDDVPPIDDVKYTREETKLFIEFKTPINKDQKKHTRVNIFMSGKVNILGAFDHDMTLNICRYLYSLFKHNSRFITRADVGDYMITEAEFTLFVDTVNKMYNDIIKSANDALILLLC